jgi:hypothetical protein
LAEQAGLTWRTLAEVEHAARGFLDPILAGEADGRATIYRDVELGVELRCEHVASALDRLEGQPAADGFSYSLALTYLDRIILAAV